MGFEKLVAEVNGGDEDWPHDRDGKGDGKGGPGRHGKGGGGPVDSDDGAFSTYEPSEVDERPRYVMRNPGARDEYERVGNRELRAKDLPKTKEGMTQKKPASHKPQKPPKANKVKKSASGKSAMKSNAKAK